LPATVLLTRLTVPSPTQRPPPRSPLALAAMVEPVMVATPAATATPPPVPSLPLEDASNARFSPMRVWLIVRWAPAKKMPPPS